MLSPIVKDDGGDDLDKATVGGLIKVLWRKTRKGVVGDSCLRGCVEVDPFVVLVLLPGLCVCLSISLYTCPHLLFV